jgi:hypothetical protein
MRLLLALLCLLSALPAAERAAAEESALARPAAGALPLLSDPFDLPQLDPGLWGMSQMPQFASWIDWKIKPGKDGVLAIRVWPGDGGVSCSHPCQRNEVREAKAL